MFCILEKIEHVVTRDKRTTNHSVSRYSSKRTAFLDTRHPCLCPLCVPEVCAAGKHSGQWWHGISQEPTGLCRRSSPLAIWYSELSQNNCNLGLVIQFSLPYTRWHGISQEPTWLCRRRSPPVVLPMPYGIVSYQKIIVTWAWWYSSLSLTHGGTVYLRNPRDSAAVVLPLWFSPCHMV